MANERGRPLKITSEIQAKIVDAIKAGNYIETAAAYAGIHKSTLYDWLKRGEREKQRVAGTKKKIAKKEEAFVIFSDAVEKALADAEVRDVMLIAKAAQVDWKAAAWRLERKFPDKWGRKDRVDAEVKHSGQIDSNQKVDLSALSVEELRAIAGIETDE